MSAYKIDIRRYNEYSILIEWPAKIDENILQDILFFKKTLESNIYKQKVEVIHAYNSILIVYDFTIDKFYDVKSTLFTLYERNKVLQNQEVKLWEIPVCYDQTFGVDLESFSKAKALSVSEIIRRHTSAIYTVYFTGFLPGFLYLGGLDEKLHLDRKKSPSLSVKKGAVAIGGNQTGIYPQDSPGGWHIIGNSPIELFDPHNSPPCQIQAGDKLKFKAVDLSEYDAIKNAIVSNSYTLTSSTYND
ncbi:5-oxoprolinase subunit PxpB [Winogradskyella poriferorum]|uniref:5-oxoprolinase subunit PxpB n=1 Tax=Winogradskyella poriferorum TaxID=307627 RepID=UPI003D6481B2